MDSNASSSSPIAGLAEKRRISKQGSNLFEIRKELLFDWKLKEKMAINNDSGKQRHMRFQKQWLSSFKVIVVLIYFVIVPYLYTPAWCMEYF